MNYLMIALWALSIALLLLGTLSLTFRRSKLRGSNRNRKGITVLKPLKGVDPGLAENLQTFFEQDYQDYELIFLVESWADPAVRVVNDLISKNSRVDAKLFFTQGEQGLNPKVRNMIKGYREAKFDLIVVSDSNVFVERGYLNSISNHFYQDPTLGVLTSLVSAQNPKGTIALSECLHLNNYCARGMTLSELVNQEFVLGKSMAFRKRDAERFGGLARLADYLAEDYMMGKAMSWLGKKVRVASEPIYQRVGRLNWSTFFQRHLRWARIRKCHSRLFLGLEVLLNAIASSLFLASAIQSFGVEVLGISVFSNLALFATMDWISHRSLKNGGLDPLSFLLSWVIKEATGLAVWMTSWMDNRVLWRGQLIRLKRDGRIEWDENRFEEETGPIFVGNSN